MSIKALIPKGCNLKIKNIIFYLYNFSWNVFLLENLHYFYFLLFILKNDGLEPGMINLKCQQSISLSLRENKREIKRKVQRLHIANHS
jgi:hypothetical protein